MTTGKSTFPEHRKYIPFTRGPLAHLLRNRFYIGEVAFKGEILKGEQVAIVDRKLFDAVQAKLDEQINGHKVARTNSEALLAGRIFDDRGNRMTPTHARKRGIKYRYYLSSVLLQGQSERTGSINRVPAAEIEALVISSVRERLKLLTPIDDRRLIKTYITRVEIQPDEVVINLVQQQKSKRRIKVTLPFTSRGASRRRNGGGRFSCLMPLSPDTPVRSARRPAPPWSPRSRGGAAGSRSSLMTQEPLSRASPSAKTAASAGST